MSPARGREERIDIVYEKHASDDGKEFFVHALSGKSVWRCPALNVWLHDLHTSKPPGILVEIPINIGQANSIAMDCPAPRQEEWV